MHEAVVWSRIIIEDIILIIKSIFWPTLAFFFSFLAAEQVGSWFPSQESNPLPLHWEHGVLTARPPEKSQD